MGGREQLKSLPGEDGDEYQPVDVTKTFHATWAMDFDGMGNQINRNEVQGESSKVRQFLDFDQAEVAVEFLHRGTAPSITSRRMWTAGMKLLEAMSCWGGGLLLKASIHQYKGDAKSISAISR